MLEEIKAAEIFIDSLPDDLNDYGVILYKDNREKVDQLVEYALKEISQIKEEAGQIGVDITDCLQDQETLMDNQTATNLVELKECIAGNIVRAKDIVHETIYAIENFIGFVTEDFKELKECKEFYCYSKLCGKVLLQLIDIPNSIGEIISHTLKTIIGIKKDILLCTGDTILVSTHQLADIIKDVKNCVAQKENKNQKV